MDSIIYSLLSSDEQIYSSISATFELQEHTGINYQFGTFIATNKRLIWYLKYPLGFKETNIFRYRDIVCVDMAQSLFTFINEVTIKVKSINCGDINRFFETIQYFSTYTPGIRNYYKTKLE